MKIKNWILRLDRRTIDPADSLKSINPYKFPLHSPTVLPRSLTQTTRANCSLWHNNQHLKDKQQAIQASPKKNSLGRIMYTHVLQSRSATAGLRKEKWIAKIGRRQFNHRSPRTWCWIDQTFPSAAQSANPVSTCPYPFPPHLQEEKEGPSPYRSTPSD